MAAEREITYVFEWLKNTKHVTIDIRWLEACISWLKMHAGNGNVTVVVSIYLCIVLSSINFN